MTCRKVRYRDLIAAKLALAGISRKRRDSARNETRFYWCGPCRAYHLTSRGGKSMTKGQRGARRHLSNSRILQALPPVTFAESDEAQALRVATEEIDRRHQEEARIAKAGADLVEELLREFAGARVSVCDRLSADSLGLVLADGSRIYVSTEAT